MNVAVTDHAHLRGWERLHGIDAPDLERTMVRDVIAAFRDGRVGRRLPAAFIRPFATSWPAKRGVRFAWTEDHSRAYVVLPDEQDAATLVVLTVLVTQADFFAPLLKVGAVA